MALLSHLLAATMKTSADYSTGFVRVFRYLFVSGQALIKKKWGRTEFNVIEAQVASETLNSVRPHFFALFVRHQSTAPNKRISLAGASSYGCLFTPALADTNAAALQNPQVP